MDVTTSQSSMDPSRDYRDDVGDLIAATRIDDAVALARSGFARWPDQPESARVLGVMLTRIGALDEAEPLLRSALAGSPDHPDFQLALGLNLLAQGRYGEGWPLYRARGQATETGARLPNGLPFPRWEGEPLTGKAMLLLPEQGLGDQIQFVRFLPMLLAAGAQVSLLVQPALERLFRENFPDATIIPAAGQVKLPPSDVWSTLLDIPGLLGLDADFPLPPYLTSRLTWQRAPAGFKVGLATSGAANHNNDAWRSLPDEAAEQLAARLPGTVIPLDPAKTGANDFAETAAIVAQLDLVMSVDTAAAHLAGAMGKTCFLLLPGFATDWRWLRGRSDTPWYPEHRLYRAGMDRDWTPVIDQVVHDAQAIAADRPA